jgi:hypothetical protein
MRELKLGRINQDKMRKWVKAMYMPESTYQTGRPSHHKGRWR